MSPKTTSRPTKFAQFDMSPKTTTRPNKFSQFDMSPKTNASPVSRRTVGNITI